MNIDSLVKSLYDKDDNISYSNYKILMNISDNSNILYKYINEFITMLDNNKSYIRVRGFNLICSLAKWDVNNIINDNIEKILATLNDIKPSVVRQCLSNIEKIIISKEKLREKILNSIKSINYLKYRDSMSSLIEKDIKNILERRNYE